MNKQFKNSEKLLFYYGTLPLIIGRVLNRLTNYDLVVMFAISVLLAVIHCFVNTRNKKKSEV